MNPFLAVVGDAGGRDDRVLQQFEADLAAQVVGNLAPLPPLVHLGEHSGHFCHPRVALLFHLFNLKEKSINIYRDVLCTRALVLSGRKLNVRNTKENRIFTPQPCFFSPLLNKIIKQLTFF